MYGAAHEHLVHGNQGALSCYQLLRVPDTETYSGTFCLPAVNHKQGLTQQLSTERVSITSPAS